MSAAAWAAFVIAAAGGATLRYAVGVWVLDRTTGLFPWGTLVINVSGSLVLGLVTGFGLYHSLATTPRFVLGTGFCGAYTTFSTFTFETVRLIEEGATMAAARNVVASALVCVAAAALGLAIAAL